MKFLNLMKRGFSNLFVEGDSFKKEFKRQVRMLIVITFGFTIAFTWRQTIFDLSLNLVKLITHIQSSSQLSIMTSSLITIFSLIIIYISAHWLKETNGFF